jgi:hypothetical protein
MSCHYCIDEDGDGSVFPSYGPAPHTCFYTIPYAVVGQSVELPRGEWGDGFAEDPDAPGLGTYWCPKCGHGKPEEVAA